MIGCRSTGGGGEDDFPALSSLSQLVGRFSDAHYMGSRRKAHTRHSRSYSLTQDAGHPHWCRITTEGLTINLDRMILGHGNRAKFSACLAIFNTHLKARFLPSLAVPMATMSSVDDESRATHNATNRVSHSKRTIRLTHTDDLLPSPSKGRAHGDENGESVTNIPTVYTSHSGDSGRWRVRALLGRSNTTPKNRGGNCFGMFVLISSIFESTFYPFYCEFYAVNSDSSKRRKF